MGYQMARSSGMPGIGCSWEPPVLDDSTPGKALRCLAKSDHFERKLSNRFMMSEEILAHSSTSSTAQLPTLLNLPCEVILDIYDSILHAPSQISLALTCKQLARTAQEVTLNLSQTSPRYAGFLPPAAYDVPELMSSLKKWMPEHLRLCGHCLTYRPFEPEYWQSIDGFARNDFWIQKHGWVFKNAGWRKQTHDICPACNVACSLSDYVDCDGCRALGRMGDVDFARVAPNSWRRRTEEELLSQMPETSVNLHQIV